ncbi:MAG: GAF domain-containing protein [Solobacterium sp.]|nr:GAF domain-containing protein [Solobacterium sp.]
MNELLIRQIESFIEEDMIASLSNISACIMMNYDDLNWAGFYLVKNGELLLGPFQGKPACVHIPFDKGVCGKTYREKKTQRVDDVLRIQDHIACDSDSRSELCVPILINEECVAEIDLDSPSFSRFTEKEEKEMIQVAKLLSEAWIKYQWPN